MCAKAFNSGWSKPIPKKFLENHAPDFLNEYGDFYKQYQYQMEVWEKCNQLTALEANFATYPTDTYYPPGKSAIQFTTYESIKI